jgi:Protein of unknown function (DUF1569)
LDDVDRLIAAGYDPLGNWSAGMICDHLAATLKAAYLPGQKGFPRFLRPILRRFVLARILRKGIPRGMPAPKELQPDQQLSDQVGRDKLAETIRLIAGAVRDQMDHPVFGRISKEDNHPLQMVHAGHHLSLLLPRAIGQ